MKIETKFGILYDEYLIHNVSYVFDFIVYCKLQVGNKYPHEITSPMSLLEFPRLLSITHIVSQDRSLKKTMWFSHINTKDFYILRITKSEFSQMYNYYIIPKTLLGYWLYQEFRNPL